MLVGMSIAPDPNNPDVRRPSPDEPDQTPEPVGPDRDPYEEEVVDPDVEDPEPDTAV
jgi:hypothetical protein